MDVPILKYIDILIGLAVVMILASTVVTALSQLGAQSSYARARALRAGLQELIANLDQTIDTHEARYIAERLLRHPMLGRRNGVVGWLTGGIRTWWRTLRYKQRSSWYEQSTWFANFVQHKLGGLPLPPVNPTSTVLREEFLTILLEWASNQGPLAAQDAKLGTEVAPQIEALRQKLQEVFSRNGIPDPGATLRAIRMKALENEKANPTQPASRWKSDAILDVASSEIVAKVNQWFDDMGVRVTGQFAFQARVWTSVMALLVSVTIQLDSLSLLKRLSSDDKLRDTLVAEAKDLQKKREDADKSAEDAKASVAAQQKKQDDAAADAKNAAAGSEARKQSERAAADAAAQVAKGEKQAADQQGEAARANVELEKVRVTLAQMREPKLSLVPAYLATERVRQAQLDTRNGVTWPTGAQWKLELAVDSNKYPIVMQAPSNQQLLRVRDAIAASGAPVDTYFREGGAKLLLAARTTDSGKIALNDGQREFTQDLGARYNLAGLWEKKAGIFLSWVLLTLGAPFWYDLLKNMLNLRSLIARKDDQDRKDRQSTMPDTKSTAAAAGAATTSNIGSPAQEPGEAGDLSATGSVG